MEGGRKRLIPRLRPRIEHFEDVWPAIAKWFEHKQHETPFTDADIELKEAVAKVYDHLGGS